MICNNWRIETRISLQWQVTYQGPPAVRVYRRTILQSIQYNFLWGFIGKSQCKFGCNVHHKVISCTSGSNQRSVIGFYARESRTVFTLTNEALLDSLH
jgi:hypothetical protein